MTKKRIKSEKSTIFVAKCSILEKKKKVGAAMLFRPSSGDIEIRTLDPLLAKQVLYQLSYTPE